MSSHTPVTDRILGAVQRAHGCDLEMLTKNPSDLSWAQVFLEVDRLSRDGQVLATRDPLRQVLINEGVAGECELGRTSSLIRNCARRHFSYLVSDQIHRKDERRNTETGGQKTRVELIRWLVLGWGDFRCQMEDFRHSQLLALS